MGARYRPERPRTRLSTVLFLTSIMTLALSFLLVKLFFLVLFLLDFARDVVAGRKIVTYRRLVWFYLAISAAGVVWAIVGWLHQGNNVGITDALRLYVMWSVAFAVLYSVLRSQASLGSIHTAMVAAGITISVINLVGLLDYVVGWGLVSDQVRKALELNIGIHEGYVQITSNNIGALFLILPYLSYLQVRTDAGNANSALAKLSLVLCLTLAALSGRRALWLVTALTPCVIMVLSKLTHGWGLIRARARRLLVAYTAAAALVGGLAIAGMSSTFAESLQQYGYIRHFQEAFSAEDERTIQRTYLVEGFLRSPVLGSGFGAYGGYLRSEARPWAYELTYHQMLFNIGIVGTAFLGFLVSVYLVMVVGLLRRFKHGSAIPSALLVAFCSLLVGAYSNPYLGSFDLLFFVGLLPYLSTFRQGFDEPAARVA